MGKTPLHIKLESVHKNNTGAISHDEAQAILGALIAAKAFITDTPKDKKAQAEVLAQINAIIG